MDAKSKLKGTTKFAWNKQSTQHQQSKTVAERFLERSTEPNKDEFPPLSEISGFPSLLPKTIETSKIITYSDKLKLTSQSNKISGSSQIVDHGHNETESRCSTVLNSDQRNDLIRSTRNKNYKIYSNFSPTGNGVRNANSNKPEVLFYVPQSSVKTSITRAASEYTSTVKDFSKNQKPKDFQIKSPDKNATCSNTKVVAEDCSIEAVGSNKKKKKRKSKIKRQVAIQTGKINVLTPEAHLKIINQFRPQEVQCLKNTATNINDSEEYPALGTSFVPKSKDNVLEKKETVGELVQIIKPEQFSQNKEPIETSTETSSINGNIPEPQKTSSVNVQSDKVGKDSSKVHPKDPITVSFFDILLKSSKPKVKETKQKESLPVTSVLPQQKNKVNSHHHHNMLDSTPVVKRGKERETPKTKRPSQLKKIILLDRKMRKERFQQLEQCYQNLENKDNGSGNLNVLESNESATPSLSSIQIKSEDIIADNSYDSVDFVAFCKNTLDVPCMSPDSTGSANSGTFQEYIMDDLYNSDLDQQNIASIEISDMNNSDSETKTEHIVGMNSCNSSYLCSQNNEAVVDELSEKLLNPIAESTCDKLSEVDSFAENHFGEKERLQAAKIVLHTRNFREYCTHLISKDIDDTVLALLEDLVRFQDRLHQKDPVKAHMKRRLVYGLKEVKKHVKLRKLKCIIIATDIENVETEGGLNDALEDLKKSASEHHTPCIYALNRKNLRRVCHKPVPISCVGIFNYEGSEVNFKKMIELVDQSTKDYLEILNNLACSLSEDSTRKLFKAKMEAPKTLHDVRTSILQEFLVPLKEECKSTDC